ncbi:f0c50ff5-e606-4713-934a-7c2ae4320587 [Thermothielavioides terrestris]|uniref:F0c50ff5-e606-4713-934a-7c2ae4320587 n=1 Tax=Thermothielavioides terrestris TaxID=2587410 RepID=A0A3S4BP43_9PEZI|nr:f0c50ff5-e606-4713-934a-7c2ae4320587 [Thermothielavioides terrestris]
MPLPTTALALSSLLMTPKPPVPPYNRPVAAGELGMTVEVEIIQVRDPASGRALRTGRAYPYYPVLERRVEVVGGGGGGAAAGTGGSGSEGSSGDDGGWAVSTSWPSSSAASVSGSSSVAGSRSGSRSRSRSRSRSGGESSGSNDSKSELRRMKSARGGKQVAGKEEEEFERLGDDDGSSVSAPSLSSSVSSSRSSWSFVSAGAGVNRAAGSAARRNGL